MALPHPAAMQPLPRLLTTRLILAPATPADSGNLAALEKDPEVMRHLAGGDYLQPRGHDPEVLTARLRDRGDFIGWFALFDDGQVNGRRQGEIGYRLHRPHWGHGYASEGVAALVDLAFTQLGFGLLRAEVATANTGSRRVLEKAGFQMAGQTQNGEVIYDCRIS